MKKNSRDAQMCRIVMRFTTFIYKESGNVSGIIFQYYNKCCYPFLDFHIKKILKMRKYKKDISKKYLKEIQKIIGVRKELEC
jgi:hypothetical protein